MKIKEYAPLLLALLSFSSFASKELAFELSPNELNLPAKLGLPANKTNAWISQSGVGMDANINQLRTGANTNAIINQRGGNNTANIAQAYGNSDLAIISQNGWGNDAIIVQHGSNNAAAISQDGNSNYAKIIQVGNNLGGVKVSQTGAGNGITVKVTSLGVTTR
ncbi:hypothetical protein MUU47_18585 [Scandinavium sp. H11S7]|uniref:Minor curlin subunit n=1 Tax=Scandinavium hiltneri TaxID=2926519 RepID=A0ABT2E7X5_9ENTR|nr:hypothetical protein [Scandinavium hiltneri]MCS2163092.1 hypothetical protein [Scandinavium hiltneri]